MTKSYHFTGQPVFAQVTKLIDKSTVLKLSHEQGGERYIKRFDAWAHLITMLYAVIMRFDSLREISVPLSAEGRKLAHLGLTTVPHRSTLSDANKRRSEIIFQEIYKYLYDNYHNTICPDSQTGKKQKKAGNVKIIDSTTIGLFSNLIFKGVGRNPKTGKKKGGVKVHTVINANEGVPSDIKFTSAATHDSFMLCPSNMQRGEIIAMDRAYIDYEKFEQLTQRGVTYVTKMKSNLKYDIESDTMYITPDGLMEVRIQQVCFTKRPRKKDDGQEPLTHHARIITYVDTKNGKNEKNGKAKADPKPKPKPISLLTNDMESDPQEIIDIYRRRWDIEVLFKQLKQNFPLKYFYGQSANAIKIQIWVTLIANLLLTILKNRLTRRWSFSGFVTMVRIVAMYYVDFYSFFNHPEKDWETIVAGAAEAPRELSLFDDRAWF